MTQDQNRPDQDVENASSKEAACNPSAQQSELNTLEQSHEQPNLTDSAFFSYSEQAPATENTDSKSSATIKMVGIIILILLLGLIGFGLWKSYQPKEVELQGRVEAETVHVSSKVPSRIEEIYIHDGQKVIKCQPLVRLFSPEVEAKKQQALASLEEKKIQGNLLAEAKREKSLELVLDAKRSDRRMEINRREQKMTDSVSAQCWLRQQLAAARQR